MSIEIIFLLIFVLSFFGILGILIPKLPELATLKREERNYFRELRLKLISLNPFKNFKKEVFLQKIIGKIRILSLKIDNLTFKWQKKLREKSIQKKEDNYWDKIKKEIKKPV